jgi:hypothetical protein
MTENVTQQHRTLKAVVMILGALIVISLGVVLTTIAIRASEATDSGALPPPAEPMPGHPVFFGDVRVIIPSGARVLQMTVSGDRLLLLLEHDGGRRIHAADAGSGIYLGTYHLTPEDQAAP